jgi:hypothetical protein
MARVNAARDIFAALPGELDQQPEGGLLGAENGFHSSATFPADRRHLNDVAVRINRYYRGNTAIGEAHMINRTISIHQDLAALADNVLKLRQ